MRIPILQLDRILLVSIQVDLTDNDAMQFQSDLVERVAAIEAQNVAKAKLLYDFLDASDFYENRIEPACRSRMNVPFFLKDEALNDAFLAESKAAGLVQLKGHKSVGGMRASIYNAMPLAGVQALVDFLRDFAARRG